MDFEVQVVGNHRNLPAGIDPFPLLRQLALHQPAEGGGNPGFLQFQPLAIEGCFECGSALFQTEYPVMDVIVERFRDRFFLVQGFDPL